MAVQYSRQSVLAFDSETGAQKWLYQPPPFCANCFHGLRADRALEGNQLLVKDIEKVGNEFGSVVTNLQVPLNSSGAPLSDPFAGYGPGSNTGIGALYPPACYISYFVSDPVTGLLTIIQPDFGGPSCGQGFAASMSSSTSSAVFGPTPGLANVATGALHVAASIWFFPPAPRKSLEPVVKKIQPQRGLIGKKIPVIISGANLDGVKSITAGPGITVTVARSASSAEAIQATFDIASDSPPGDEDHEIVLKLSTSFVTPALTFTTGKKFFVQVPTYFTPAGHFATTSRVCRTQRL